MHEHSRSINNEKQPPHISVMADEYIRLAYHGKRAKDKLFQSVLSKNLISSDCDYKPLVKISTKETNGKVKIRVKDNDLGISAEIKDKILYPFIPTKLTGEGTGLGLSLAYDIIAKGHEGELKVESDNGSCFTILIRLNEKR